MPPYSRSTASRFRRLSPGLSVGIALVIVHTVTADPEEATVEKSVHLPDGAAPFDSGDLDRGETFTYTFETPGTYRYFCIPHEGAKMFGTVVVEEP
jgi:plastocyanin